MKNRTLFSCLNQITPVYDKVTGNPKMNIKSSLLSCPLVKPCNMFYKK